MRWARFAALVVVLFPAVALARGKVIGVGFDGVDARYTDQWMNEGKLPNLARLRAEGTFRPLRPTLPAQTPVSWSTFSTGIDPGRTGIFDFLRRDPNTYLPFFAAFDESSTELAFGRKNPWVAAAVVLVLVALLALFVRRSRVGVFIVLGLAAILAVGAFIAVDELVPRRLPRVVNRRQGTPFWEVAASAGKKALVVHVPVTFPANDFGSDDHLLSGL